MGLPPKIVSLSKIEQVINSLEFHPLKDNSNQADRYEALRAAAIEFAYQIDDYTPESREQSLAFTHLEETLMWAIKSIAVNE